MFNRKLLICVFTSVVWAVNVSLTFAPQFNLNITLNE